MRFVGVVLSLALGLLLSACSPDVRYQTKSLQGLMPDLAFELTDEQGRLVTAADTAGNVRLLFFGYTSCPDICPMTLARLAAVVRLLPAEAASQVRVLFVSVDPQRDSVEKLGTYVAYFGKSFIGLRGTEPQLRVLAKRYRTTFGYGEPDDTGFYEVSHSSGVYVFDGTGKARLLFRPDDTVEAMAADLQVLLQQGARN